MITKIHIVNCGSIRDAEISFSKARYQYLEKFVLNDKVANPIAFYGHNGSGKSSFLSAIEQMISLLTDDKNKLQPFLFNLCFSPNIPSGITVWFDIGEDIYCYSIKTTFKGISSEKLIVNNVTVLNRDNNTYKYKATKSVISAAYYPALRSLYNSSTDESEISKAYSFLSNIVWAHASEKQYLCNSVHNKKILDVVEEKSSEAKQILKQYGSFPIYDVVSRVDNNEKRYFMRIEAQDKKELVVPYEFSSSGMRNQSIILSLLLSIPENGVLIIDEIESALHPETVMNFIEVVIQKKIQLIFSSHNTNILSYLRPDNIFFAHWEKGESTYKKLSDIYPNIRQINNIEKMYLSSMFDDEIAGKNE